jgi:hypothetical protein
MHIIDNFYEVYIESYQKVTVSNPVEVCADVSEERTVSSFKMEEWTA